MQIERIEHADERLEWEVELDLGPEVVRFVSGCASRREEVGAGHARQMVAVVWR